MEYRKTISTKCAIQLIIITGLYQYIMLIFLYIFLVMRFIIGLRVCVGVELASGVPLGVIFRVKIKNYFDGIFLLLF